jgi:hypothetical protein
LRNSKPVEVEHRFLPRPAFQSLSTEKLWISTKLFFLIPDDSLEKELQALRIRKSEDVAGNTHKSLSLLSGSAPLPFLSSSLTCLYSTCHNPDPLVVSEKNNRQRLAFGAIPRRMTHLEFQPHSNFLKPSSCSDVLWSSDPQPRDSTRSTCQGPHGA